MRFSRQLPFDPAVGAGQRIAFRASRVVGASGRVGTRLKFGAEQKLGIGAETLYRKLNQVRP